MPSAARASLFVSLLLSAACLACGSGAQRAQTSQAPSPTAAVTTAAPSQKPAGPAAFDPSKAVLTIDDMPTGWTQITAASSSPGPGSTTTGSKVCDQPAFTGSPTTKAEVEFNATQFDLIDQVVSVYPPGQAAAAMSNAIQVFQGCTDWTDTGSDGTTETFHISPLSFPKLGDQTEAVRLALQSSQVAAQGDVVIVRRGDVLDLITHITGALGQAKVDSSVTETVARSADGKVQRALAGH